MRFKEEKIRESVPRVVTSEDIVGIRGSHGSDKMHTPRSPEPHEMRITDDSRMQPRINPTS